MGPINPIGGALDGITPALFTPARQTPATDETATLGSSGSISAQAVMGQSSLAHITQVHSQVDAFLGTFGIDLQNNQVLRMIIALLILELLLGRDGVNGRGGGGSRSR
jgi:hypothetical protein